MALRIAGSLGWRSVCMVRRIRMVSHQLSCAVLATNSFQLTTMNVSRVPSKSCKSASAPFSTHNNHHKHDLFLGGRGTELARKSLIFICQMFTKMHYFTQNTSKIFSDNLDNYTLSTRRNNNNNRQLHKWHNAVNNHNYAIYKWLANKGYNKNWNL